MLGNLQIILFNLATISTVVLLRSIDILKRLDKENLNPELLLTVVHFYKNLKNLSCVLQIEKVIGYI